MPCHERDQDQHHQHDVVVGQRIRKLEGRRRILQRELESPAPTKERALQHHCPRQLRHGERRHCEVDSTKAETEADRSDRDSHGCTEQSAEPKADPRCEAELQIQHRREVAARPEIDRIAQRELAGEATDQIPALAQVGVEEGQDRGGEKPFGDSPGKPEGHNAKHKPADQLHARAPKNPEGRMSRITMTRLRLSALLSVPGRKISPTDWLSPTTSPPASEPTKLPIPPRTTTTMATNTNCTPRPGVNGRKPAIADPAIPAHATLRAKAIK